MRILHIADRLSARGGADWHLLGVLAEQIRDHQVSLAVAREDGTAAAPCPVHFVEGLDARVAVPVDLGPLARRLAPDVIHLHNVVNPAVLEWAADRGAVMTVQDHRAFCPGMGKLTGDGRICRVTLSEEACRDCFGDQDYYRRIMAVTRGRFEPLRRMTLTVLSRYMQDELVQAGLERRRIHVIPPFVHGLDRSATPSGERCVLFAGRLVRPKGIWDAAEAWRLSGLDLPLVFAGTGSERNRLEAASFRVTGWMEHHELAGLYASAEAVLFPPRWQEPFGITGLEALTMGVPVAAWESGGVAEWHPGGALLVPWGDVDRLASALRAAVGTRAREPSGFSPERLMKDLETVYRGSL